MFGLGINNLGCDNDYEARFSRFLVFDSDSNQFRVSISAKNSSGIDFLVSSVVKNSSSTNFILV